MDFVKLGCEESWVEVQEDSFSFKCKRCTKMKELEVELDQLRLFGVGTVDDKVGEDDERYARKSSHLPGRRLRGGMVTGRRETGRKETERKETGRKE